MASRCYCSLLRDAARKATAMYDDALAPAGVTVAQYRLLRIVERAGPLSLTELARVVDLDRSTVGRNVRLLQRLGMVRLMPGADQREAKVELDEGGTRALAAAKPLWDAAQARIEACLGADVPERLRSLLAAL